MKKSSVFTVLVSVFLIFWGMIALAAIRGETVIRYHRLLERGFRIGTILAMSFCMATQVASIMSIIAGIGVLWCKPRARLLGLVSCGYFAIVLLVGVGLQSGHIATGPGEDYKWIILFGLFIAIFHGLIIWYFLHPGVKAQFKRNLPATETPST